MTEVRDLTVLSPVPCGNGRFLKPVGILQVVYTDTGDGLWEATLPAIFGDRPSFGKTQEEAYLDLLTDIRIAWRVYAAADPAILAPDAIKLAEKMRAAFQLACIPGVYLIPLVQKGLEPTADLLDEVIRRGVEAVEWDRFRDRATESLITLARYVHDRAVPFADVEAQYQQCLSSLVTDDPRRHSVQVLFDIAQKHHQDLCAAPVASSRTAE